MPHDNAPGSRPREARRNLATILFSRLGLIVVLLLVQFGLLAAAFLWFENLLPHFLGGSALFTVFMVIVLLNSDSDPTAKISWLIVIMILPVFGALLYWYTKSDLGHRLLKSRLKTVSDSTRELLPQSEEALNDLAQTHPYTADLASYLRRCGPHPVFRDTEVRYFPSGEDAFEEMLRCIESAKRCVYLEFFIVAEGGMWDRTRDLLARKAAQGVDVRLMYDGTCEFTTLPHDYPRQMEALGIRCKMFAPATPFVSTHYNYRDHRKIVVVDGHTAITGGFNLADEYINARTRFGHWKDAAIRLTGPAARSFMLMFLQMWNLDERYPEYEALALPAPPAKNAPGYVIPFGDCPLDGDKVGERVYMDILNTAHRYVHIMTPYLILDGELETAVKFAAERGVDVKIILPGIPDKLMPYALAKSHYASLLRSGVEIYEYTPGFLHSKVFVSDDSCGVVGTINLDYRSLYHHFECAAYLKECPCLGDIEKDFRRTLGKCRAVTLQTLKYEKWYFRLLGPILKAFAPLL